MTARWKPTPSQLAHFWLRDDTREVVASGEVAEVYRILQRYGVAQRYIAAITGQLQSEVAEILTGRKVRNIDVLCRIADGLALPRAEFGLPAADTPPTLATESEPEGGPDPRADSAQRPAAGPSRPALCDLCRLSIRSTSPLPTPVAPVLRLGPETTLAPAYWTGVESAMLRHARRMTTRAFAAHLGVSDRLITKWETGAAGIRPNPLNQAALDSSLNLATPDERARFTAWLQLHTPTQRRKRTTALPPRRRQPEPSTRTTRH